MKCFNCKTTLIESVEVNYIKDIYCKYGCTCSTFYKNNCIIYDFLIKDKFCRLTGSSQFDVTKLWKEGKVITKTSFIILNSLDPRSIINRLEKIKCLS